MIDFKNAWSGKLQNKLLRRRLPFKINNVKTVIPTKQLSRINRWFARPLVPKVCSVELKESATNPRGSVDTFL